VSIQTGVAYFEGRAPRHTGRDLDDMVQSGCTYVVHCYSEFDVRWASESMRRLVADTKARGLGVWLDPWGVGEVFGGEPFSRFGAVHPDARQIDSNGVASTHACLNQPAFRAWVHDWIDAAVEAGGETIFWDEPTWEIRDGVWSCRCQRCQALFRERTGTAMPIEYVPEVRTFLEASMADLLSDACRYARAKGLQNALCIMPPEATNPGFSDWDTAASIEALDNFGTDPYWLSFGGEPAEYVDRHTRRTIEVAERHGLDHHVWIQGFEIPAGREPEIAVALEAAADAGARNIAVWSYDGCAALSTCACERPEEVWRVVGEGFRRIRARG
jgi:hypothetical protein